MVGPKAGRQRNGPLSVPNLNRSTTACRPVGKFACLPACRFDWRSSDAVSIGRETSCARRFLISSPQASMVSPAPSHSPLPFPGNASFGSSGLYRQFLVAGPHDCGKPKDSWRSTTLVSLQTEALRPGRRDAVGGSAADP
jgi:hypothetical protein